MKKKSGFTLAEVLITLVIIGIIAAMTIPTLMNKTNEQETVVAVKKAYSVLSQAWQRMVAENGEIYPLNLGSTFDEATKNFGDMFVKYLNVQKVCGQSTDGDCWSTRNGGMYTFYDGSDYLSYNECSFSYKATLNDGTFLALFLYKDYELFSRGTIDCLDNNNVYGYVHVDVNGDKGPNSTGKDVFVFWITKYGFFPTGTPYETELPLSTCKSNGSACAAWVIAKGNMDYLRKEVSW